MDLQKDMKKLEPRFGRGDLAGQDDFRSYKEDTRSAGDGKPGSSAGDALAVAGAKKPEVNTWFDRGSDFDSDQSAKGDKSERQYWSFQSKAGQKQQSGEAYNKPRSSTALGVEMDMSQDLAQREKLDDKAKDRFGDQPVENAAAEPELLRRAHLDIAGALPTNETTRATLNRESKGEERKESTIARLDDLEKKLVEDKLADERAQSAKPWHGLATVTADEQAAVLKIDTKESAAKDGGKVAELTEKLAKLKELKDYQTNDLRRSEEHPAINEVDRRIRDTEDELASLSEQRKQAVEGEDVAELMPAASFKVVPVNPWTLAQEDNQSTFGLDVDTASYSLARRYLKRGYLPPVGSVRMEEFVNAFDYNYPTRGEGVFTVHTEAAPAPFAGDSAGNTVLLKVGVKGKVIGRDGRKPANLVLVIDASGSMSRADRLPLGALGGLELGLAMGFQLAAALVDFDGIFEVDLALFQPLDDLFQRAIPGPFRLLKIDVEGEEERVVCGALQTLQNARDFVVVFEAHPRVAARTGSDPSAILRLLMSVRPIDVTIAELPHLQIDPEAPFFDQLGAQRSTICNLICVSR